MKKSKEKSVMDIPSHCLHEGLVIKDKKTPLYHQNNLQPCDIDQVHENMTTQPRLRKRSTIDNPKLHLQECYTVNRNTTMEDSIFSANQTKTSDGLLTVHYVANAKQRRSASLFDEKIVWSKNDIEIAENKKSVKQRRSTSLTVNSLLLPDEQLDLKIFESNLSGRKWRSASLIAAQCVIEQEFPFLKNKGYEELAIEAKLNLINTCQIMSSNSHKYSSGEGCSKDECCSNEGELPCDCQTDEEDDKPKRKLGISEKHSRERDLVKKTLRYYQQISNWFIWLFINEKE